MKMSILVLYTSVIWLMIKLSNCSDITNLVFEKNGNLSEAIPAAFGDFNSDELTDIFVLRDDQKVLEILLANEEEPLIRSAQPPLRCKLTNQITSVVPGDFDGDALMDVMVTVPCDKGTNGCISVKIFWGGANSLNCVDNLIIDMIGEPLAIDYNQDMIIDLFGMDQKGKKTFWVFNKDRSAPNKIKLRDEREHNGVANEEIFHQEILRPHANAFLDWNGDFLADLFVTTPKKTFEIWLGTNNNDHKFALDKVIKHPEGAQTVGQSLFIDVELNGQMDLVTPVCYSDYDCDLVVYNNTNDNWHRLHVKLMDENSITWGFAKNDGVKFLGVITLRSGDFNLDGYPDILATLQSQSGTDQYQSVLLENVPCKGTSCLKRTFQVNWSTFSCFQNRTTMAAFFDFYQDGILDVILVTWDGNKVFKVVAFKNSITYDANFIKVMVLTGLTNQNNAMIMGRVRTKRRTYGTNLPGPFISYKTTTQEGYLRHGAAVQLSQSAHFSLNLPYTIFGLGRTPNYVEILKVGLSNQSRDWTQVIPNSQMVVIPWPTNEPSRWKMQLFVTPSKLILKSVAAISGICGLITIIIAVLYWKERQEDKKERLSESHRFHFDAM